MATVHERELSGLDALAAVTSLSQRVRAAHPTAGLFEAADFQWWWRVPRTTDEVAQLFWFDDHDRPVAGVIATDWGERIGLDPITMPGAEPGWVTVVIERGLAHAAALGFEAVGLEVDRADDVTRGVLGGNGFEIADDGVVESWIDAGSRPPVSSIDERYRLESRRDTRRAATGGTHHMDRRPGPGSEARLRQASLYRDDLDLVVLDSGDEPVAYGLFWFDPVTKTGLVEPMRTEDSHQGRGLARHVLTAGLDLLADAGATRIKICFEPANAPARHLYLDVGFVPDRQTDLYVRRNAPGG
jgi:GNAT superfamily N-acetyltransferase